MKSSVIAHNRICGQLDHEPPMFDLRDERDGDCIVHLVGMQIMPIADYEQERAKLAEAVREACINDIEMITHGRFPIEVQRLIISRLQKLDLDKVLEGGE